MTTRTNLTRREGSANTTFGVTTLDTASARFGKEARFSKISATMAWFSRMGRLCGCETMKRRSSVGAAEQSPLLFTREAKSSTRGRLIRLHKSSLLRMHIMRFCASSGTVKGQLSSKLPSVEITALPPTFFCFNSDIRPESRLGGEVVSEEGWDFLVRSSNVPVPSRNSGGVARACIVSMYSNSASWLSLFSTTNVLASWSMARFTRVSRRADSTFSRSVQIEPFHAIS
mmetsp:Transcript_57020/g.114367  ORF Transcript_57020/g.114367 Transcript_57020/m.114367 type:complete len:229 (+) Transcript_57020:1951-2637(+)